MTKFTKEDFKGNSYNITIINVYAIILAIVYGYWMHISDIKSVFCWLVAVGFIISGIIITILSMRKYKRNQQTQENDKQDQNLEQNN